LLLFQQFDIGYETILILVILELIFAFGVGLSCIIFSINLVRAISSSHNSFQNMPIGTFPHDRKNASAKSLYDDTFSKLETKESKAEHAGTGYNTFLESQEILDFEYLSAEEFHGNNADNGNGFVERQNESPVISPGRSSFLKEFFEYLHL